MDKKQLKHITGRHYRKLNEFSKGFLTGWDANAIHLFRVEYKKLRAFLRMISGSGEIKIPGKLKKTYHIAGFIRDLHLQEQRILDATKKAAKRPQAYLHLLQLESTRIKPELLDLFSGHPVEECKKKTNATLPKEYSISSFRNYADKMLAAIYTIILSGDFSDDHIHQVRKHLKDLLYNLKTFEESRKAILPQNTRKWKMESSLEGLLTELGSFQDKCTSLALLRPYWILRLNKYNRDYLQRIKETWIQEKMYMKKLLIIKLRSDFVLKTIMGAAGARRKGNL